MTRPLLPLVLILLAGGCARDATVYPSLAPRAAEQLGFAEPETPAPELKPDPALDTAIVDIRSRLATAASDFAAAATRAERAAGAAHGARVGSEPWLEAQSILAELDDHRARTSSLLSEVDARAGARAEALAPPYPALSALRDAIDAEGTRQSETIARLQATLPPA